MTEDKKREILAQVGRVNSDICYGCPIIERYLELMSAQPEIVRCKDCKYGDVVKNAKGELMIECVLIYKAWLKEPEWFCADGERKDESN